MEKLLNKNKVFGRCSCKGHGQNCGVSVEIQSMTIPKVTQKAMTNKMIAIEIENYKKED